MTTMTRSFASDFRAVFKNFLVFVNPTGTSRFRRLLSPRSKSKSKNMIGPPSVNMSTIRSNYTETGFFGLKLLDNEKDIRSRSSQVIKTGKLMIVGLGNSISPNSRHSVGMTAVDVLGTRLDCSWEYGRDVIKVYDGAIARCLIGHESSEVMTSVELFLFKPKALMNLNGRSVLKAAKHIGVKADEIYLVHDEMEKSVGKGSLKEGGSARGHKGVRSCYDSLSGSPLWPRTSEDCHFKGMTRLLIGIGRPVSKSEVVPYVLAPFEESETEKVKLSIDLGLDLLLQHIAARMAANKGSGDHGERFEQTPPNPF